MTSFEQYLEAEGLRPQTTRQHRKYASYFLAWMAAESLTLQQITYAQILDFVEQQKEEKRTTNHLNRILASLRYYFRYLQKEQILEHNPASGIQLKGAARTVPHELLSKEELEELLHVYVARDARTYRNKVILGLLIYQAVTRQELEALKPEHVNLREGKIYIPGTGRTNSRILPLQAHQILPLQEYIHAVRSPSIWLFTNKNGTRKMNAILLHLNYGLRRLNPRVKNAVQIRQSVITEWLKEKDLRTVQYRAGHRYVSSTERYQTSNLEELREAIKNHHPLK